MIGVYAAVKAAVIEYLSTKLSGVEVVGEFPSALLDTPPESCRISVGIAGVLAPCTAKTQLILRFDILCPPDRPGGCSAVFDRLCDTLPACGYYIGGINCEETRYESSLACLTMTATATISGLVT